MKNKNARLGKKKDCGRGEGEGKKKEKEAWENTVKEEGAIVSINNKLH